ncbi:PfaD family polyunsaturated fatty acid/polyketide biosynthesis protein [Schlesneria paludicola]|uniref:PfaD family polyunsaturated fatty acid/polyketide biosynthesis protein n=1 Tax=Schlesneria paludicola TaxID=360056 RepID=UPI00029A51BC|nr:PfaD family polyunsaturated fatty acid/polyketide biosynthesis protein [Schlesneria paludicola]
MTSSTQTLLGWWSSTGGSVALDPGSVAAAVHDIKTPLMIVSTTQGLGLARGGVGTIGSPHHASSSHPIVGVVPPVVPEQLGDDSFRRDHGLRFAYVSGAMAAGIGSEQIVEEMAEHGMLGVFGSAGLSLSRVEAAIDRLSKLTSPVSVSSSGVVTGAPGTFSPPIRARRKSFGINLIHSPNEQALECALVDLYLRREVRLVEASAYLDLTPHIVRYRLHGIHRSKTGEIVTPNRVIAKVSRIEVGSKFFAPASAKMLSHLVEQNAITAEQAHLAEKVPIAQDMTAEADSGGHTDNRPALTLLPTILALRDRAMAQYKFEQPLRVGAAGGISTPASTAAAFAMGAAYVLVGSVQQACVESGTCDSVRQMLADAEQADVTMCPCADMFEMGVKVQVLKRGTMFPMRAAKLYEIYRNSKGIDEISKTDREWLEKNLFRTSLEEIWLQTAAYFSTRNPAEVERGERDPKHKMALVFRWYLGQSSRWANTGEPTRKMDYQIWCGPAMGAFNEWTRGTFLAEAANRRVATVAFNLLHGAAVMHRLNLLRNQGFPISAELGRIVPSAQLVGNV